MLLKAGQNRKPNRVGVNYISKTTITMNEIIKMVASKTGMSESVAKIAVDVVVSQLKSKLPAGVGVK